MKKAETQPLSDAALIWQDYRLMLAGRTKEVVEAHVAGIYSKAAGRAKVLTDYMDVVPYLCGKAAGAFGLPLAVTPADGPVSAMFSRDREEWEQAWQVAWACGHTFLHLVKRSGRVDVEHLWPDDVTVVADPSNPRRWDLALSVSLVLDNDTALVYAREAGDDGRGTTWRMETKDRATGKARTDKATVEHLPCCPVMPLTNGRQATLNDSPRSFIRDLGVALGRKMTATEFRSVYRTSQMWRKSENGGNGAFNPLAPQMEAAPDAVIELGPEGAVGVVESSATVTSDLDAQLGWLRLACVMLNLPPDVFPFVSRSETGAARQQEALPLQNLQERDRSLADEALARALFVWRPLFKAYGMNVEGASAKTVAPAEAVPTDRLQEALGIEKEWELGLTDPTYVFAKRRGYGMTAAKDRVAANQRSYKAAHKAEASNGNRLEVGAQAETGRIGEVDIGGKGPGRASAAPDGADDSNLD
jgi:hypothetical protein